MVFASLAFIFLVLPAFLALDFIARFFKPETSRNFVLLLVSMIFYIWGEAANVFLLLGLGVLNYAAGYIIPKSGHSRAVLIAFIGINLGVLVKYKYFYWIISLFFHDILSDSGAMPLGISFFTFHAISYLIDVYRKHIEPARNPLDFLTYFCMFPHLVAGPIVRYAQVRDDLVARGPDRNLFSFGMYRFLIGLNKKVIIANSVAPLADSAFSMSAAGGLQCPDAWIGITAYAIQIYFDFSGYSDMAIGLAAMAGFRFEENFRRPYSSTTIREFWRRWHISLSSWLRDYVYIPLGGNKGSRKITYRNLILVFFLCGLWHGADLTFIIWGLWHGLFLILERTSFGAILDRLPRFLSRFYLLLAVLIGWVFFRAENIHAAALYLNDMFSLTFASVLLEYHTTAAAALAVGIFLCLFPDKYLPDPTSVRTEAFPAGAYGLQVILAVFSVALLLTGMRNPFIYFNF